MKGRPWGVNQAGACGLGRSTFRAQAGKAKAPRRAVREAPGAVALVGTVAGRRAGELC
jgi:hypothetical protein